MSEDLLFYFSLTQFVVLSCCCTTSSSSSQVLCFVFSTLQLVGGKDVKCGVFSSAVASGSSLTW